MLCRSCALQARQGIFLADQREQGAHVRPVLAAGKGESQGEKERAALAPGRRLERAGEFGPGVRPVDVPGDPGGQGEEGAILFRNRRGDRSLDHLPPARRLGDGRQIGADRFPAGLGHAGRQAALRCRKAELVNDAG
ncbi:hypothetical protein QU38_01605, partial [Staphylococcus aureus]